MDTALSDSECYGLESSDVRMSCFFNKVGTFPSSGEPLGFSVALIILLKFGN